jgi:hypothetical protein
VAFSRVLKPLKLPVLASACAFGGQLIWLMIVGGPDDCSVIGDRGWILFALVAAGAIGEACAAAARGRGWVSRVLWLTGSAVILFGWAFLMWLLAIDAGKCFD